MAGHHGALTPREAGRRGPGAVAAEGTGASLQKTCAERQRGGERVEAGRGRTSRVMT